MLEVQVVLHGLLVEPLLLHKDPCDALRATDPFVATRQYAFALRPAQLLGAKVDDAITEAAVGDVVEEIDNLTKLAQLLLGRRLQRHWTDTDKSISLPSSRSTTFASFERWLRGRGSQIMFCFERQLELAETLQRHGLSGELRVVGQERDELLIAREEAKSTTLFLFDTRQDCVKTLYSHGGGHVVGASLDPSHGMLAVTTQQERQKDGLAQLYYKTSLAEVLPAGESYRLNVRSQQVQRVQFVGLTPPSSSSSSRSSASLFLFLIEGLFVRLYQMHSRRRPGGGVKITAQPVLLSELTKKFDWVWKKIFSFCFLQKSLLFSNPPFFLSFSSLGAVVWREPTALRTSRGHAAVLFISAKRTASF